MATEIRVPALGESISEAIVGKWFKNAGDAVKADEPLVELETDKVTVEVPAPVSGVLGEIKFVQGQTVAVGALLGAISNGGAAATAKAGKPAPAPAAAKPAPAAKTEGNGEMPPSPAARKKLAEAGIDAADVVGSGKRGQILKEDVPAAKAKAPEPEAEQPAPAQASAPPPRGLAPVPVPVHQFRSLRRPTTRRAKSACACRGCG